MDISTLIPQLFYDVIGRIIPGATLLTTTLILLEGPDKALRHLSTWSDNLNGANIPTTVVILGNLVASHILASLIGGIWFRVYRISGWAAKGEKPITERFTPELPHPNKNEVDTVIKMESDTNKIAYLYDYVLLHCPKAGARVAKLRAELHMSGVLMIGFTILALFCLGFPYMENPKLSIWVNSRFSIWITVEFLLILAVICAGFLALHLEKRCGSALYNL